jgi:hypothetical protein
VRVEQARRDAAEHQAELELQREHNKIWLEGFKNHYQDSAGK